MNKSDKIFIAGHRGMVGSAIVRNLKDSGFENIITKTRSELNLCDQLAVKEFYETEKPDVAIIAAAKVGGIHANNTYPAEFIYENLAIAMNCIHSAYEANVKRLLFLGSSCIYPRNAPQPMSEDVLLTSALEQTNEAYALAKIAGLKLCQYYRKQYGVMFHSGMPTNLYGPGDNYHPENSHVLPALIRRFHEAKEANAKSVMMWGTGTPMREFLHVDDLAAATQFLLKTDKNVPDWVNMGTGTDITIADLGKLVAKVVGFKGEIEFDTSKPDGTPKKLMDVSKIKNLGWSPKIDLETGIRGAYEDFKNTTLSGTARL